MALQKVRNIEINGVLSEYTADYNKIISIRIARNDRSVIVEVGLFKDQASATGRPIETYYYNYMQDEADALIASTTIIADSYVKLKAEGDYEGAIDV